ncbi:MAG: FAD-dependent oxidoreductase [Patescibacteria group bacterium]
MIYDLIIIGADSAGLTAGVYAGRKMLKTLIVSKKLGGQTVTTNIIENIPGFESITGPEFIIKLSKQAQKYGAEIKEGIEIVGIERNSNNFLVKSKEESFETKTIIIATGRKPKDINVPGEKEFKAKGISYCTTCDAPIFTGKDVAVIGSGNAGLESALDLAKYANKIYVLGITDNLVGDEYLQERIKQTEKIKIITQAKVKEIKGSNFVEKIIYEDQQSQETKELNVQGVFINIGWLPATDFLKEFPERSKTGEIIVNYKTMATSVNGIFAAGDVTDGIYKQIVIAASDGARAALSAYNYLSR